MTQKERFYWESKIKQFQDYILSDDYHGFHPRGELFRITRAKVGYIKFRPLVLNREKVGVTHFVFEHGKFFIVVQYTESINRWSLVYYTVTPESLMRWLTDFPEPATYEIKVLPKTFKKYENVLKLWEGEHRDN